MELKSWDIRVITKLEHLIHKDDADIIFDSSDAYTILDLIDELQKEIKYLEEDKQSLQDKLDLYEDNDTSIFPWLK